MFIRIILLPLLLLTLSVFGQPNYKIQRFSLHDGLPSNIVTDIVQTPDHLMWFATWNGLSCYDSYGFTTFSDRNGIERTLTTNRILRISVSPTTGNIWCLAHDLQVFLFNRHTCRFINVSEIIQKQTNKKHIFQRISVLPNGQTWLFNFDRSGSCFRIDEQKILSNTEKDISSACQEYNLFGKKSQRENHINGVAIDSKGREWLLSSGGTMLVNTAFKDTTAYTFAKEVDGQMLFCTRYGRLGVYDEQKRRISPLPIGLTNVAVKDFITVANHSVAILTGDGLLIYHALQHKILRIAWPAGSDVSHIQTDSHHRIWAFQSHGSPLLFTPGTGRINPLSVKNTKPELSQSAINLLHEDGFGNCWIATVDGFFGYYDEQRQQLVSTPIRTDAGQSAIVHCLSDRRGDLWLLSEKDVTVVNFTRPIFKHVALEGLHQARSVYYDSQGRLWVGDIEGHTVVVNRDNRLIGYLAKDGKLHSTPQTFSIRIYCFFEDSRHRLWIGTKGDGLYCLHPDGRLSHYLHDKNDAYSLCSNQIYDVLEDSRHRLWVGTFERGICLIDESDKLRFIHYDNILKSYPVNDFHKVRRMTENNDGAILVSASNGLVTFSEHFDNPANIRFFAHKHIPNDTMSLYTSDVMQTFVSHTGRVFVATVGGSLQEMTDRQPLQDKLQMKLVKPVDDNMGGTILSMQEDLNHHLWIGCESSLMMYLPEKEMLWNFGAAYLGEHTEFTEAPSTMDRRTGQMAFATTDGYLTFHPDELSQKVYTPPIVFKSVNFHGQKSDMRILTTDYLDVPSDQRNLTIHFAALDYQDNHTIHYAYRLEGIDNDWNDLDQEHSISFSNLPEGRHRLLVRSTDQYGSWADNTQILNIYVHPTFWETWWAVLLYVLLGLGVVAIAVWIYRLHIQASMERQLNLMKTQFFTDISHKLRTPLTLIGSPVKEVLDGGGLTDMARHHLEMVYRNAHNMLQLVNKMLTYSKENNAYISDETLPDMPVETVETADYMPDKTDQVSTRLLIVEDNTDLRSFLKSILQNDYEIIEAANGREGLERAQACQPDFILTDVMMPEMDGLEMVHHIKADSNISHIPIVILSAKASLDDRIEGLKAGVNDYITKPFSATYLKQRMQNIIANQHMLQQSLLESIGDADTPDDIHTLQLRATHIVDSDKLMMEQLIAYIEDNLGNASLKIEDLAGAVNLGRTVFYTKVKTLVGMNPVELLRHIRIQHAEDMVARSAEPFSQIAYMVGFSDSRYFGRCFKKQTGMTPSEYREYKQTRAGQ